MDVPEGGSPEWLDRSEFPFNSRWWMTPHGAMHYIAQGEGPAVVLFT